MSCSRMIAKELTRGELSLSPEDKRNKRDKAKGDHYPRAKKLYELCG